MDKKDLLAKMKKSMENVEKIAKIAQEKKIEKNKKELESFHALPKILEDLKKYGVIHQDTVSYNPDKFSFSKEEFSSVVNNLFDANLAQWNDKTGPFNDISFPRGEMLCKVNGVFFKIILQIGQGSSYTLEYLPKGLDI